LLTLPVISTAGAVLRLEVLHYNVLTHSRGKDAVLGVVEIPLSDLPNANLRHPGGIEFDGYCDRWYRLVPSDELDSKSIVLSKPIISPDLKSTKNGSSRKVGMQSLEEVGKRMQALAIAPVEWFASVIKLDLPARRPEAICQEHKARSMIHVRIKLNASVVGDVLSHAWFPPVRPRPLPPPYDPQILLSRVLQVGKQLAPYRTIMQYIEFCIKWKHDRIVCFKAYFVFAFHLAIFPHVLPLFHLYLFIFLAKRLREMRLDDDDDAASDTLLCSESFDDLGSVQPTHGQRKKNDEDGRDDSTLESPSESMDDVAMSTKLGRNDINDRGRLDFHNSPSLTQLSYQQHRQKHSSSVLQSTFASSSNASLTNFKDKKLASTTADPNASEEEETKLHYAVHWIAKRWGDNKGLEILQFKLGMLGHDLHNINSVWNGTNPLLTRAAMLYLVISCLLHFLMSQRLLWLLGTSTWYFAQAPFCILLARFMFGFWRGIAKVTRRQHLLDAEILSSMESS